MRSVKVALVAVLLPLVFTTRPAAASPPPTRARELSGRHAWSGRITLDAPVTIAAGGELVILPGTRIEAAPGASLDISRDARLIANGTVLQPIVFTCTSRPSYEGCWEGLTIRGNAKINFGTLTSPPPRGNGLAGCRETLSGDSAYGGCDDADSSGVLRYVRVEHARSGLQLLGAGSGTVVDFVQVNRSRRDGLRVVGGKVNLRHVFLTANREYGLTWLGGWRGNAQFVAIQQDATWQHGGILASNAADDDSTRTQGVPRSAPVLHNVTIVAPSVTSNPFHATATALVLARGTSGQLRNVLAFRPPIAFGLADASTCVPFSVDPPVLTHTLVAGAGTAGDPDADPTCLGYTSPDVESLWLADPANASRIVTDPTQVQQLLIGAENLITPDGRPRAGTDAVTLPPAAHPADPFFVAAPYIGAVTPAGLVATNIPWNAGWTIAAPLPPAPGSVTGIVASPARGAFGSATVSSNVGTGSLTNAAGQFSLSLPAGDHLLGVTGLPPGCGVTPSNVTIPGGANVTANLAVNCVIMDGVTTAASHACARTTTLAVQCWGENANGALGVGSTSPAVSSVPLRVVTPFPITDLTSGYAHTCGLAGGTALCWGLNAFAALGNGAIGGVQSIPLPPQTGGTAFTKIAAGGYHTCGLTAAGEAWCWGWNAEGQTGIGSAGSPVILPQRVQDGGLRFAAISAGESHTCALTLTGTAYCWGGNARGELGSDPSVVGAIVPAPIAVPANTTFLEIDGGLVHTCAVDSSRRAWCWGDRSRGQIGDGLVNSVIAPPTMIPSSPQFLQLSVGGETTCGIVLGVPFAALCWGRGDQGSLGNGTNTPSQPTAVTALHLLTAGPTLATPRIDVGPASGPNGSLVCAVNTLGETWCWGPGHLGQLGDGSTSTSSASPRRVLLLPP
jgi:alpha-tubulin suppressor-like RCC1 family protein